MSKLRLTWMSAALLLLVACTHSPPRMPANIKAEFNAEKTRLLRLAADHGVLFQIPESVIRDLPSKSAGDRCRKTENGQWAQQVYSILETFQQFPTYAQKIHVIEFKRGDRAHAEISRDLDGATHLVVSYSKVESRQRIHSLSDIPCSGASMELVGRDMVVTEFEWPDTSMITKVLASLPNRPDVARFRIDPTFLRWLADRMTIFRLTPELAFEKTHLGEPLLPVYFAQMSREIQSPHPAIEFWLHEISQRSRLGQDILFFGLKKDLQGSLGIQVDSAGKFARKMNGFVDPSYPYLSYRVENDNGFNITHLDTLNQCLGELMRTYRSPLASMGSFETDADSFLFPGHHCP